MKLIPVLFNTDMVQAERAGRKKMTRRMKGLERINENPDCYIWLNHYPQIDIPRLAIPYDDNFYYAFTGKHDNSSLTVLACPYGQPGDVLWVRETWCQKAIWEIGTPTYEYKADFSEIEIERRRKFKIRWKPSIFMPFKACRVFLKITSIGVERLHDITEQDAIDEGVLIDAEGLECWDYIDNCFRGTPVDSFNSLWVRINGQSSYNTNPWVWVISFERIKIDADVN